MSLHSARHGLLSFPSLSSAKLDTGTRSTAVILCVCVCGGGGTAGLGRTASGAAPTGQALGPVWPDWFPSAHRDGASQVLGFCYRDFQNWPYPFRVRITYWGQTLHAPLQPFLEMEKLCLVRQLERLRAKLARGTREDLIPKLSSKDQEEGERILGLEETLGRHSQILQALQGLSEQLAQAERQWKKQLGFPGKAGLEGTWDSAKVSTLLCGQQTLLPLQEMRDAAAYMASRAQVFYLEKVAAKDPCTPGQCPGAFSCLQP
ncbi:LOW QUALITY PROTEIN: protein ERGIC-53-like [Hipposideros larvatus]